MEICIADSGVGRSKSQIALIGREGAGPVLDIREAGGGRT